MLERQTKSDRLLRFLSKAQRYYGFAIQSPYWALVFLVGRFKIIQRLAGLFCASSETRPYQHTKSLFPELDVNQVIIDLRQEGVSTGLYLPESGLQELSQFVQTAYIYARTNPTIRFLYSEAHDTRLQYGETFVHGCYEKSDYRSLAIVKQLEQDPKLLEIAARYLGVTPVHIRTELAWCFVAEPSLYQKLGDAQFLFHYDLDDFRAIKFFFYLTEVDQKGGPHVYVRGSHRHKSLAHQLSLFIGRSDTAIHEYYGASQIVALYGKPGFGFVEDPLCFHRGTPPVERDRLMLQIEFGLRNTGLLGIDPCSSVTQ